MIYVIVAPSVLAARVWANQRGLRPTSVIPLVRGEDAIRVRGLQGPEVIVVSLGPPHDRTIAVVARMLVDLGAAQHGPGWWPGGGPPAEHHGADLGQGPD